MILHGTLKQIHTLKSGDFIGRSQQHQQRRTGTDQDGIDKDTECLHQTCFCRMADISGSGSTWSRSASGLIRKQTAFDPVHQHGTESTGSHLTKTKSFFKNPLEHRRECTDIFDDDKQCDQEITAGHDWNNDIQDVNGGIFAKNNDRSHNDEEDRGVQRRNVKCILYGGTYGVADNLTDAAPADQARDRKQNRDQAVTFLFCRSVLLFRFFLCHKIVDVVGRTAAVAAVERILLAVDLSQCALCKSSGGAKQSKKPHPEYRTGTAGRNSSDNPDQIAHADTGGSGNNESLKSGNTARLRMFVFLHGDLDHMRKLADQDKPGADCKIDPCRNQKKHQK